MVRPKYSLMLIFLTIMLCSSCGGTLPPLNPAPPPVPVQNQWQTGQAIWYGMMMHGRPATAGGAIDMNAMTASHGSMPLGSKVEVVYPPTGKKVVVEINDRHNLEGGQVISLSKAAAVELGAYPQNPFAVKYRWIK